MLMGDIAKDEAFREMFTQQLNHIWRHGVKSAIVNYCENSGELQTASQLSAKPK